jgi:hypothetical protein
MAAVRSSKENRECPSFRLAKNPEVSDVVEIVDGPRFLFGMIWEQGWFFMDGTPCGVCDSNPGINVMSPVWEPGGRLRYFVWVNGQAKDKQSQIDIQKALKTDLKLDGSMTAQQQIDAINKLLDQNKDKIDWNKGISAYNSGGKRLPHQNFKFIEGELPKKDPYHR